jgi:putative ABC transport system permease protein
MKGLLMNSLINDLRLAARVLVKTPAFTIIAVMALALGIGASTAIFSVVNTVLLRPLPYSEPDRLVELREYRESKHSDAPVAPGSFLDWQQQSTSFDSLGAYGMNFFNLTGGAEPERVRAAEVSAGLITLLGVNPAKGRDFRPEEDRAGGERVAIISHGLWQRHFGGGESALGRQLQLNGTPYTVVGVMPASYIFPARDVELWTPLAFNDQQRQSYGMHRLSVIGRLKKDASIEQARAEIETIAARISQQHPDTNTGWSAKAVPMLEFAVGSVRPHLVVLLGAVAFMLLIACANVANLLLARASARQKEVAIRTALGAKRGHIVRQFLTESVLLALVGGGAGLLLAAWSMDALVMLAPEDLPRIKEVAIDGRVLLFTLAVSTMTGILFGLAPALQASRPDLTETLKEGGRGTSEGRRLKRSRNLLVVAEVALAIVLLIAGGLLVQSFARLQQVSPGFNPEKAIAVTLSLPQTKYPGNERITAFYDQLTQKVSELPGVESVGGTHALPIINESQLGFRLEGAEPADDGSLPVTNYYVVSPDYFKAMGIQLMRGRAFTAQDGASAPRVAIINETMARKHFQDEDPIGKRISVTNSQEPIYREVVGVVADVKQHGLSRPTPSQFYEPFAQQPLPFFTLIVRGSNDPSSLAAAVRAEVLKLDKEQPIARVRPLETIVSDSIARQRFSMLLLAIFAAVALVLAAVGLYGVVSYSVAQRTHEIGIRMALGASSSDVLRMVIGQGMRLAGAGMLFGLVGAFVVTRALKGMLSDLLFGVSVSDPVTFTAIPLVLLSVALAATYIPARRATRVDPMVALRHE